MTPTIAAEGRRLLESESAAHEAAKVSPGGRWEFELRQADTALSDWLWANREELVRCAELAAEPQSAPGASCACYGEPIGCCELCECGSAKGAPECHHCDGPPHTFACPNNPAMFQRPEAKGAPALRPEQAQAMLETFKAKGLTNL